ncbi:scaffold protein [Sulfitobacter phage phiGT1]|nr:scaffold protein [Sulfitobacter phage phiGT1]
MTDEPDNATLDEDATDNVNLSEDDNADEFDYFDPDEDTEEVEAPEATDDEPDEAEAEEAEDQEAEGQDDEEPIEAFVEKLKAETPRLAEYLSELEKGNLRQSDYTRKSQEVANVRKTVEADVQRMQRITEVFVDHISGLVPEAPDASLAYSDPNKYTAMKDQHEAAMGQVQKLIELGEAPKEIGAGMSEADKKQQLQEANQRLIEMFPEAAEGEGRKQFFGNVQAVANEIGFSDDDLGSVSDPRIFALAHWAKKGMDAEKAKAVAKAKVAKAPPATPRKPGQGARKPNGNAEAMRKLSRSGSLKDALSIDFD